MAVVVAFFICWAPFHTQRLVSSYANSAAAADAAAAAATEADVNNSTSATVVDDEDHQNSHSVGDLVFFYVSGVLYYVSSVINPILYNIMSVKFRQAFADTILHCGCCLDRRGGRRAELAGSRLMLAAAAGRNTPAVRRYRFAATGGSGRQSLEPGSSDAGSHQRQRLAAEDGGPMENQLLTSSSLGNGRQVRSAAAAADTIVLVEMHLAETTVITTTNSRCTAAASRWFT